MRYTDYVDVFQGCGEIDLQKPEGIAAKWFFIKAGTGNTSPAATLPFGGMSVSPYSGGYPQGYGDSLPNSFSRPRHFPEGKGLLGFSHLQQSGTGAIGFYYNYAVVTPKYDYSENRRVPKDEFAEPGYYRCVLDDITCELTAAQRSAIHRYTFGSAGGYVDIDLSNNGLDYPGITKDSVEVISVIPEDDNTVSAAITAEGIRLYFRFKANGRCSISGSALRYYPESGEPFELKVSLSLRSSETAKDFLESLPGFDAARSRALDIWEQVLSRIDIDVPDERTKRIFYSNLYHSYVKPADRFGESFIYPGNKPFCFDFATLWDMYKTALPLIFMTDRNMSESICETLLSLGETLGHIPNSLGLRDQFESDDGQARMLGDYALLTAFRYGVNVDPQRIVDVIKTDLLADNKRDFTVDGKCASATFLLDMSDCCGLARDLSVEIGDDVSAGLFDKYADLWKTAYDSSTGLLSADSRFYEGTLYNYSFRQMLDMRSRIYIAGGNERFVELLDRFFGYGAPDTVQPTDPSDYAPVAKGIELGRFEGFNNESDTEAPFSYVYAGRHDRTCEIIRAGMKYMFSDGRGGIPGNNDSGALSSYYVLSALGIFPVAGQDLFILGSPFVRNATVRLSSGCTLTVKTDIESDDDIIVNSAKFNGKPVDNYMIKASELMRGGELEFRFH